MMRTFETVPGLENRDLMHSTNDLLVEYVDEARYYGNEKLTQFGAEEVLADVILYAQQSRYTGRVQMYMLAELVAALN